MLNSSQLAAYLRRIGVDEPPRPTLSALVAIHRAHVDAIAYENLEIQLGRPIRLEDEALFAKLVERERGGYCYEQNHVLAMALEALGFDVRRVLGGVARETEGDGNWYNHMPLVVRLGGGEYLVDAGLGTGFRDPLPLRVGSHRVGPFNFGMWHLDDVWRCSIDPRVTDLSFDFTPERREVADFADKCRELSTSPESPFVKTLTVQQPGERTIAVLRARTLTVYDPTLPEGKSVRVVADLDDFASVLGDDFGLGLSAADTRELWDRAAEQHERKLAEEKANAASALLGPAGPAVEVFGPAQPVFAQARGDAVHHDAHRDQLRPLELGISRCCAGPRRCRSP